MRKTCKLIKRSIPTIFVITILLAGAVKVLADLLTIDFESYTLGTIHGQDGWSKTGPYDVAVVSNTYGYATFGSQSLRISNAITSGSFGDHAFSKPLTEEAGETGAYVPAPTVVRHPYFVAEWDFASTVPGAEQTGLSVVASPDRGDGGRMSWLQMTDTPSGLEVNFYDYQDVPPYGSAGTITDGYGAGDAFVFTTVASGLDRTVPHTIKIEMFLMDGPHNDIVRIYVDGVLGHTGTSWEDYFRWTQGPGGPEMTAPVHASRVIRSMLFRVGGTAAPATSGMGFLIDNLSVFSGAIPCLNTVYVDQASGDDAYLGDTPATAKKTIQAGINAACPGGTVIVAPGTYPESPVIAKSLTLVSSGGRDVTTIELQTGPGYLGGLNIRGDGTEATVEGFTIKGFDAVGAGLASSNIVIENGALNTPAKVFIKNNRVQVGNIGAGANGDDGMGLITYYNTSLFVDSLVVEDNIFEPLNTEAFRAFYINPGTNAFVFRGNEVTGQFNATALTQAKDGLVEENTVTGTGAAGSRSAGLGTWGYPTPSDGYGKTTFRNNVISDCRGISIYETENVIVENNFLTNCDRGVGVFFTGYSPSFDATTIHIRLNSITGSHFNGVQNDAATYGIVDAERNWWDSSTGPAHASNVGGTGNSVSDDVDYNPWLCDGTDTDAAIGFQPNVTLLCGSEAPPKPFVFLADEKVTIARAKQSASMGDIHSNGLIFFQRGDPNKFTGNLTAVGDIKIEKEIKIMGDAAAGGKVLLSDDSYITGTKTSHASVAAIPIVAPAGCAPSGTNHTVKKGGLLTLAPGMYGNVILGKGAELRLSAGSYCFNRLETDSEAELSIDVSGGAVTITVMNSMKFGKKLEVETSAGEAGSSAITFNALQSTQVLIDKGSYVLGNIIAPNAEVFLSKNVSFRGSICAKRITVDRDVVFLHHTSPGSLPKPVLEEDDEEEVASEQLTVTSYQLEQNYPNPFNPSTTIKFAMVERGQVQLRIFNEAGQLVRTLANRELAQGWHELTWDGRNQNGQTVATGVYLYRIIVQDQTGAATFSETRRMSFVK